MTVGVAVPAEKMVVLLLGAPASGKTTQARKISAEYGIPAISMADILRTQQGHGKAKGSSDKKLNKRLEASVASGTLVSSEVAAGLVHDRITQKDAARGFVLDGYPTTKEEAASLENTLAELGLPKPMVVDLVVSDEVARQRMSDRRRADDKVGLGDMRLEDWRSQERAILEYYPQAARVDAAQGEAAVWAEVKKALANR